jgi:hypothetical protein
MVSLCQDAKAHVLHVLHLMLHVHPSCYMTCYMWSLHDTCHVMTTLYTTKNISKDTTKKRTMTRIKKLAIRLQYEVELNGARPSDEHTDASPPLSGPVPSGIDDDAPSPLPRLRAFEVSRSERDSA